MRAICVDDDALALRETVAMCRALAQLTDVVGFSGAEEALEWLAQGEADIALLDIRMPRMDGMELARRIRRARPNMPILFVTGHAEYAMDAFELRASGYLLKPVDPERLAAEVAEALSKRANGQPDAPRVAVRTFGAFELLVDGAPVAFPRSKAKELLAYLVDRQGSSVSRASAFAALYEDTLYSRPMQKQLDVVIRSLRRTLCAYGVGDILQMQKGTLRVRPERLDCDMYRFFSGDIEAIRAYRGEYMKGYLWANMSEPLADHAQPPQPR